jgi:hypothetical protein
VLGGVSFGLPIIIFGGNHQFMYFGGQIAVKRLSLQEAPIK